MNTNFAEVLKALIKHHKTKKKLCYIIYQIFRRNTCGTVNTHTQQQNYRTVLLAILLSMIWCCSKVVYEERIRTLIKNAAVIKKLTPQYQERKTMIFFQY
jgi:hypothetical protein